MFISLFARVKDLSPTFEPTSIIFTNCFFLTLLTIIFLYIESVTFAWNDPNKKIEYQDLPDGFFHEESTLLNNPPSELRGLAKNRFYQLYHDPQKYAVEPFRRLGEDTYQTIMNEEKGC